MTLSGPPSSLQDFLSSGHMRPARKLQLPIYGLFHASHLLLPDVYAIVGRSDLFDRPVRDHRRLLHPRFQNDTDVPSLGELLVRAVSDIFRTPLDIDDDMRDILRRTQGRNVHLISVGPARMSHLEHALTPTSVHRFGSRTMRSRESRVHSPNYEKSIAVVGMAGRFPDAQNVDELWQVLIENRDLHRIVSARNCPGTPD